MENSNQNSFGEVLLVVMLILSIISPWNLEFGQQAISDKEMVSTINIEIINDQRNIVLKKIK